MEKCSSVNDTEMQIPLNIISEQEIKEEGIEEAQVFVGSSNEIILSQQESNSLEVDQSIIETLYEIPVSKQSHGMFQKHFLSVVLVIMHYKL